MVEFAHLEALDVKSDMTAEYTLHQITVNGKTPVLIVGPATEANKPYFNALLKRTGKTARQFKAAGLNATMIEENREEDRELYPKYVVKGWRDVVGDDGSDAKFGPKDCAKLIKALPNWLFDEVSAFCREPQNFVEVIDIEVQAKN